MHTLHLQLWMETATDRRNWIKSHRLHKLKNSTELNFILNCNWCNWFYKSKARKQMLLRWHQWEDLNRNDTYGHMVLMSHADEGLGLPSLTFNTETLLCEQTALNYCDFWLRTFQSIQSAGNQAWLTVSYCTPFSLNVMIPYFIPSMSVFSFFFPAKRSDTVWFSDSDTVSLRCSAVHGRWGKKIHRS